MTILCAFVLGLVQGVGEFLPISSSGHLVLVQWLFGLEEAGGSLILFDVFLHIATLMAVVVVLRKEIWAAVRKPLDGRNLAILVSCLPTIAIVLVFKAFIEKSFSSGSGLLLGGAFLFTAAFLLITELLAARLNSRPKKTEQLKPEKKIKPKKVKVPKRKKAATALAQPAIPQTNKPKTEKAKNAVALKKRQKEPASPHEIGFGTAFIMGTAQGIATIPGISRSGSTICAGVLAGKTRESAANFSFLMSIPIILASLAYELMKYFGVLGKPEAAAASVKITFLPAAVAFITALIFGMLSIKFMLRLIKKLNLKWFSLYLLILGLFVMVLF